MDSQKGSSQDGQGADELLAGYDSFVDTFLGDLLRHGRLINFCKNFRKLSHYNRTSFKAFVTYFAYTLLSERMTHKIGKKFGISSQSHLDWINPDLLEGSMNLDPFRVEGRPSKTMRALSRDMVYRSNLPMLLRFEDRNSMAHSIEARVPFVDKQVVKFALSLPDKFLLRDGVTKPLLRDALGGYLPVMVKNRSDKIGFQTDEENWIKTNCDAVMKEVEDAVSRLPNLFGPGVLKKVNSVLSGHESYNNIPWRIVSLGVWARVFDVNS